MKFLILSLLFISSSAMARFSYHCELNFKKEALFRSEVDINQTITETEGHRTPWKFHKRRDRVNNVKATLDYVKTCSYSPQASSQHGSYCDPDEQTYRMSLYIQRDIQENIIIDFNAYPDGTEFEIELEYSRKFWKLKCSRTRTW